MQHSGTDLMIFPVPVVIAYVSTFTPLAPGDGFRVTHWKSAFEAGD